jgi:hypothetical protein
MDDRIQLRLGSNFTADDGRTSRSDLAHESIDEIYF